LTRTEHARWLGPTATGTARRQLSGQPGPGSAEESPEPDAGAETGCAAEAKGLLTKLGELELFQTEVV